MTSMPPDSSPGGLYLHEKTTRLHRYQAVLSLHFPPFHLGLQRSTLRTLPSTCFQFGKFNKSPLLLWRLTNDSSVAYAYTTRHLVVSPLASLTKPIVSEDDLGAARNDIAQAAPFLVDRRSTIIFSSVDQVITEIWSRMDAVCIPRL